MENFWIRSDSLKTLSLMWAPKLNFLYFDCPDLNCLMLNCEKLRDVELKKLLEKHRKIEEISLDLPREVIMTLQGAHCPSLKKIHLRAVGRSMWVHKMVLYAPYLKEISVSNAEVKNFFFFFFLIFFFFFSVPLCGFDWFLFITLIWKRWLCRFLTWLKIPWKFYVPPPLKRFAWIT